VKTEASNESHFPDFGSPADYFEIILKLSQIEKEENIVK